MHRRGVGQLRRIEKVPLNDARQPVHRTLADLAGLALRLELLAATSCRNWGRRCCSIGPARLIKTDISSSFSCNGIVDSSGVKGRQ